MEAKQPFTGQFRQSYFGGMMMAFGERLKCGNCGCMQRLLECNQSLGPALCHLASGFYGDKARLAIVVFTGHQSSRLPVGTASSLATGKASSSSNMPVLASLNFRNIRWAVNQKTAMSLVNG